MQQLASRVFQLEFSRLSRLFVLVVLATVGALPSNQADARAGANRTLIGSHSVPMFHENEINTLIAQMSLEEKVSLLGGTGFDSRPIQRLGIPSIKMTDGPLGVRQGPMTAFPAGIAMGASWDPGLIQNVAAAIAEETRFLGKNMLLGPCVNISRTPFGGRNFESFGEDPFLSSILAADYVRGIQGQGVLASVKHFAMNDQEHDRFTVDVRADARTMFELHFPMFKAAVDAGSWTVMASYNKVNGRWASENDYLLNKVLKDLWGFKGLVVSDWGATHSTIDAANAGLDLEMPFGEYFNHNLVQAVREGKVAEATIDDKVRRILRAMYGIGLMGPNAPVLSAPKGPASVEHQALALKLAQESIVLLKNDGKVLPLRQGQLKSIAVIGPNAAVARTGGGGSSKVIPYHVVTPLEGLEKRLGPSVKITYAIGQRLPGDVDIISAKHLMPYKGTAQRGLKAEYFANKSLSGQPFLTRIEESVNYDFEQILDPRMKDEFSVRWSGLVVAPTTGKYTFQTKSDDGVRLFVDGKEVISNWTDHGTSVDEAAVHLVAGQSYDIRLEYYQGFLGARIHLGWVLPYSDDKLEAVQAARNSDAVVIFSGFGEDMESEAIDRTTMAMPEGQSELIRAVAAANPNTVVVLVSGNPMEMNWLADVPAVVHMWYPGQEGGNAIADVLLGRVNPSGKLPVTFLKRWEDSAAYGNYPGANGRVEYKEGVFVGYRHHDKKSIEPNFPFGHGLSYTDFKYSDIRVDSVNLNRANPMVRVSFKVTNVGAVEGAEVAQLYVGEVNSAIERPVRELKGFEKVKLAPGQTKRVSFSLDASAFSYFDASQMRFRADAGDYVIEAGSSSRDLRLRHGIRLH